MFARSAGMTARYTPSKWTDISSTLVCTPSWTLRDLLKKQFAMSQVIKDSLVAGIVFGDDGVARAWHPVPKDRVIILDPRRSFGKGDLERAALRQSGLNVFRLNKAWNSHNYWTKTHCIVRWWPRILQQADLVSASLIEVPWTYGAHGRFNLQSHR